METPPLLSVVTVTFNAAAVLERTLQSVAAQQGLPLEYIVIDGGSTDGTLGLLKRYAPHIGTVVSKPDRGIYDAMNKGLALARGEWINFMNAGDIFCHPQVAAQALAQARPDTAALYGNYRIVYPGWAKHKQAPGSLEHFHKGMALNHQSVFLRTQVARQHPFNLSYSLAADFEQLYALHCEGSRFQHVDMYVADYADGGQSARRKVQYLRECLRAVKHYRPHLADDAHFARQIRSTHLADALRRALPTPLFMLLMRLKNKHMRGFRTETNK